ncbi:MAG TPA: DUF6220 domain-containing protein [Solirubrobacteraceae bacterium]|nr:DUF6220 domain-containing protein [Solirubrobacteraceae bacterium]
MQAVRRGAAALHLAFLVVVIAGVFCQVYLAGSYVFGAGDALDAHRGLGWATHSFETLVLVAALVAWLPRSDIGMSFALFAIGTLQVLLAGSSDWVGGLHALGALMVVGLAFAMVARRRRTRVLAAG